MTQLLSDVSRLISALWDSHIYVIVSGKNIEHRQFRQLFFRELGQKLGRDERIELIAPSCDYDLAAAVGAACLSIGDLEQARKQDTI